MLKQPSELSKKEAQALVPLETDIVSGHLFFCRRIELPEGLEASEIAGVVELELDKLSPFPIEHLHFGYLVDTRAKFVWVYASYRKRVESGRAKSWEKLDWATVDYVVGLLANADSKQPLIVVTPSSLVALQFDELSELPKSFRSVERVDEEERSLKLQISEFVEGLNLSTNARIWQVQPGISQTGQELILEAVDFDSKERFCYRVPRSFSWNMDIRDSETIAKAQAENRRNLILWKVVLGMSALLVLLIVGEFAFGAALGYKSLREAWNGDDGPQVEEIRSMQSTVAELNNFKESDLVPFEMLAAIEPFRDVKAILYSRVETDAPNALVIDGEANNISERNAFKSRLESFNKVDSVEIESSRNTQKGTEFSFIVTFKEGTVTSE